MSVRNLTIGLILIVAACLSTALMLHYQKHDGFGLSAKRKQTQPNLIVINSTVKSFTQSGQLKSIIKSPKVIHYPDQNSTVLIQPNLTIFTEKQVPWKVSAENGMLRNGDKIVHLWGNVVIQQATQSNAPGTTVKTSEITFYPSKNYADTDQEVIITRPGTTLQSKGMNVNFKTGILTTKSQTRGSYAPKNQ